MSKTSQKGFTLVELFISIALLAISVAISSDMIMTLGRTYGKAQIFNDTETAANFIFQKLQTDLKGSVQVEVLNSGKTLKITKGDGSIITYSLDDSVTPPKLTRNSVELLDRTSTVGGVKLTCTGACFELVNQSPITIQTNFVFSQAYGAGLFNTSVSLKDAFVVRGSY